MWHLFLVWLQAWSPTRCLCEYPFGDTKQNGIICGWNGSFDKVANCYSYQFCFGETNSTDNLGAKLCFSGKVNPPKWKNKTMLSVMAKTTKKSLNLFPYCRWGRVPKWVDGTKLLYVSKKQRLRLASLVQSWLLFWRQRWPLQREK